MKAFPQYYHRPGACVKLLAPAKGIIIQVPVDGQWFPHRHDDLVSEGIQTEAQVTTFLMDYQPSDAAQYDTHLSTFFRVAEMKRNHFNQVRQANYQQQASLTS